jgi:hypothetical protein
MKITSELTNLTTVLFVLFFSPDILKIHSSLCFFRSIGAALEEEVVACGEKYYFLSKQEWRL